MKAINAPLKPEDYFPRLFDRVLPSLLNSYKVIEFEGPQGCGKTYTCLSVAQTITHADEETMVLPLIQSDPRLAIAGARPHAIDEWGVMPELQEIAYREAESSGALLMTTSIRPASVEPYVKSHGRTAAHVRMRTLSTEELGFSDHSVSLAGLFEGKFHPTASIVPIAHIASYICKGGWPRARGLDAQDSLAKANAHLEELLSRRAPGLGKKAGTARDVLAAAVACRGDFTYDHLADIMRADGHKPPSRNTLMGYLAMLERLYLLERIDGWAAPVRAVSRVKTKPRYWSCDPSIGMAARKACERTLLSNAELFSRGFKSMALRDLLVYTSVLDPRQEARICYYADSDGLEVDFVLLLGDGRWAPINVEIGEAQVSGSIKRLERLRKKVRSAGKLGDAAFAAVVLATTERPRRDNATGTYIFPITSLAA